MDPTPHPWTQPAQGVPCRSILQPKRCKAAATSWNFRSKWKTKAKVCKSFNTTCEKFSPVFVIKYRGRNPANYLIGRLSPIIYKVLYIPGCAGFLPVFPVETLKCAWHVLPGIMVITSQKNNENMAVNTPVGYLNITTIQCLQKGGGHSHTVDDLSFSAV